MKVREQQSASPSVERGQRSREQRREEMSERIVETALRVLGDEGFEAVTIQRLAGELGCAVGALYRYFKSKDALLVAVLRRIMDRLSQDLQLADKCVRELEERSSRLGERVGSEVGKKSSVDGLRDPIDRVLLRVLIAGEVYVNSSMRHAREFGLVSTLMGDPRELLATDDAAPLLPPMMRMLAELTRGFADAIELGAMEPGSASARAVTYWSALQGILQLRKLGRFGASALHWDQLAPDLISGLLIGWGGERARIRRLAPQANRIWNEIQAAR